MISDEVSTQLLMDLVGDKHFAASLLLTGSAPTVMFITKNITRENEGNLIITCATKSGHLTLST